MYLIIDFGLTKLANKAKKKAWDKKTRGHRGKRSYRIDLMNDPLEGYQDLGENKAGERITRGIMGANSREAAGLPQLYRKPRSGEFVNRTIVQKRTDWTPDTKNYTDIRKTDDYALSDSGYMGFKNTPNSFHEEAIPMIKSVKKIKDKDRKSVQWYW